MIHGLVIFEVEEQAVHGGSLRIHIAHAQSFHCNHVTPAVAQVLALERATKLECVSTYSGGQPKVDMFCTDFIQFFVEQRRMGKKIAGYGVAAKGNTLQDYGGIRPCLLPFVSDITSAKQGKFLSGSHIPALGEERLRVERPDYIVIFPWMWKESIIHRLEYTREWNAKFATVIPKLEII